MQLLSYFMHHVYSTSTDIILHKGSFRKMKIKLLLQNGQFVLEDLLQHGTHWVLPKA